MENISKKVKIMMKDHKNKIELFQWALMESFASLFYSYYISQFRQKHVPTHRIFIPSIKSFKDFINPDNGFMQRISNEFIDGILNKLKENNYSKYLDCLELIILKDENIEIFKTIFDLYMIPNLYKYLPESFINKFDLNNEKQQIFIEDEEFVFDIKNYLKDDIFSFLVDETILQFLILFPSIEKDVILPENNESILVTEEGIVTICNEKALSPILLNHEMINKYPSIIKLINFVSSTTIEELNKTDNPSYDKDYNIYVNKYSTNPFNEISITILKDPILPQEK